MSLNLASIVQNSRRYHPDAIALIHDDRRIDYREFERRVASFAAHLVARGVRPGDRVSLFALNGMGFTIAYFGILHAGATVVPISFLSVAREVAYALEDSESIALIASKPLAEAARGGFEKVETCHHLFVFDDDTSPLDLVEGGPLDVEQRVELANRNPDDTAVILYTSGTTGQPKGAELTHFNMYSNAEYAARDLLGTPSEPANLGPGHVTLSALPLFHSFGQTANQNASVFGGAALSYMRRFEAQSALEVMERDRVTLFAGVPTMYFQLLEFERAADYDLSSLRFCSSGGAAMPVDVMRAFDERYGVKILEGYGLSETSPIATFNVLWNERKPGSIGEAIFGCEVRVFDEQDREVAVGEVGEIVIRGYNVMKGYYNRPEATAEAMRGGWFHTGDMGKRDDDGYFYIVDRKKDLIIRGGFNVYPREVEEVLYGHPAVVEAAVVGVPDDQYGEEVKAYVALRDESATSHDIREYCKERLSSSKYPRIVEVLPELPKGSTGKILRKELRARGRG